MVPQQEIMVSLQDSRPPLHEKLFRRYDCVLLIEDEVCPKLHQANWAPPSTTTWYLDNRARNHMTGNRKKFQKLDEGISGKVKFGDGSLVEIQGKGTILFGSRNGEHWMLEEVLHSQVVQQLGKFGLTHRN